MNGGSRNAEHAGAQTDRIAPAEQIHMTSQKKITQIISWVRTGMKNSSEFIPQIDSQEQ